jgi:hypothetical protein
LSAHPALLLTGWSACLKWCQRQELNLRPKAYESSALPLSYAGKIAEHKISALDILASYFAVAITSKPGKKRSKILFASSIGAHIGENE